MKDITQLNEQIQKLKIEVDCHQKEKLETNRSMRSLENEINKMKDTNITVTETCQDQEGLIRVLREKNEEILRDK